jgi:YD repeat-containing protein
MPDSLLSRSASFRKASSALTRAAAILLTLWISLLAGISSATVHHGQEGVDPASYPLAAYGYDANGNLAGVSYANKVTHAYAYNTLNRLTGLAVDRQPGGSGAIATPLHGYGYTLNLAGQRTHIVELGGRTIAHTYDALHRLTSETIGHAQGNSAPTPLGSIRYDYDAYGTLIGFAKCNAAGDLEIQNPQSSINHPQFAYLFTREQWDADLGIYFLRARYLNPGTGRFRTSPALA